MSFLKNKIEYFGQHWFVKRTITLQSGVLIGNFTQALIGVFMARLLQPERFGIYTLAMGLAALLSIFLTSGAQDAISSLLGTSYAQKDELEISHILAFFIKITFLTGLISLAGAFLGPVIASAFYHNTMIGWYASLVVVAAIISSSLFSLSTVTLQVAGKIKTMMFLGVVDQVLRWGLSLVLVFWGYGIWGAMFGHFLGAIIIFSISFLIWGKIKKDFPVFPALTSLLKKVKEVSLKKYLAFSVWTAIDRNVANLYFLLPVVLAGIYISVTEVTYFKLAFGYINLSLSLLGPISVLLNVEFPKMRVENSGSLSGNFVKVSLYSVILSTLITGAVALISWRVFKILYGQSFLPGVPLVTGLFIYGALFGIGVGLGPMWRAINRVKTSILINSIALGVGIPSGLFLIKHFGVWGAVIMVTLWVTVSHFVSFLYLVKLLRKETVKM